jgi:hypothetical protein
MRPLYLMMMCTAFLLGFIPVGQAQPDKGTGEEKKDAPPPIVIEDQLDNGDARDLVTNQPFKAHVLKMVGGKLYQIVLMRKEGKTFFNPYVRVEDSAGKQLAAGGGVNARVRFLPPKDDTYRVIATTQGGVGEYILKIERLDHLKVLTHEPGKEVAVNKQGVEFVSDLNNKDARDRVRQAAFAKIFLIKMTKGKSYTIDMESTNFDTYLRVEDPTGKQLAEDDDSGGNLNARLTLQAPADGTYRFIATTFAPNAGGSFTLMVREN